MNLVGYNSDSDDSDLEKKQPPTKKTKVNVAPAVDVDNLSLKYIPGPDTKTLTHNVPYTDLVRPFEGPANPFSTAKSATKNILTGYVEEHHMSDYSFDNLQRTFQQNKYTIDPETGYQYVGDVDKAMEMNGKLQDDLKKNRKGGKKNRKKAGDPSDPDGFKGPWAGFADDPESSEEDEEEAAIIEKAEQETKIETNKEVEVAEEVNVDSKSESIFHGQELYDYLGRTYMHVPTDVGVDLKGDFEGECFVPKKCIHTWIGHTKAVNKISFFPQSGHLLLSCSMDGRVKLWDVFHQRKCLRTFSGHSKGVKDISFSAAGKTFVSASYDKYIKLWDTETGKCLSSFTTRKIPFCVQFHPKRPDVFLTGCADKKVYQFDTRTNKMVQEYDQHLGAVNTITFVDQDRRFVTTSDDKSMRAWEFGIPVVIKYIAEPDMHSMPAVTISPNKKYLACQSLDNRILVYSAGDKLKMNRNKVFKGHLVAGYACKPSFSPDNRFLTSGDSEGTVWFWDWKTARVLKKLKAHTSIVIGTEWHPHETSKLATCSWDGTIKYWD